MKKGEKMSEAQKAKQSNAMKGKRSPNKGKKLSEKTKRKISKALKGKKRPPFTDKTKRKMSNALKGNTRGKANKGKKTSPHSKEHKRKISDTLKGRPSPTKGKKMSITEKRKRSDGGKGRIFTDETRRKISAIKQGIPYDEWETFACDKKYCPKFNEACRESCRAKYNYECFVCGLPQSENKTKTGKVHKLSVHHVDMDKAQGCESNWKLVPLCMKCHATSHNDELIARLGYLIKEK